jgi:hypothetical protein
MMAQQTNNKTARILVEYDLIGLAVSLLGGLMLLPLL